MELILLTFRILNQCHSVWSIPMINALILIEERRIIHVVAVAHNDPGYGQESDSVDALQRVRPYSIRAEDPQCICVGGKSLDNLNTIKVSLESSHFLVGVKTCTNFSDWKSRWKMLRRTSLMVPIVTNIPKKTKTAM